MKSPSRLGKALIFIFVCLVLIGSFFVAVVGDRFLRQFNAYTVEFRNESVSGLSVGSRVQYRGIAVGDVQRIRFHPDNVEVIQIIAEVEEGIRLPADVRVSITPVGISGLSVLEFTGGTSTAETLEPGAVVQAQGSVFSRLTDSADGIALNLEEALEGIVDLVGEENRNEVRQILADVQGLVAESSGGVRTTVDNVTFGSEQLVRSIESISRGAAGVERIVGLLESQLSALDLETTMGNLNQTVGGLNDTVARIDGVVAGAGGAVDEIEATVRQNRQAFSSSVRSLQRTMDSLSDLVTQLNNDPSLLIRGRTGGSTLR